MTYLDLKRRLLGRGVCSYSWWCPRRWIYQHACAHHVDRAL
jgi:hypothetical protein